MNLKTYYDAALAAEADVQNVLNQMDALLQAGDKAQALELRPALDEAKTKAKEANEIYMMMREGAESTGNARNFVPAGGKKPEEAVKTMSRADFEALEPSAQLAFIKQGGQVTE